MKKVADLAQFDPLDGETCVVNRIRRSVSQSPLTLVLNVDFKPRVSGER